VDSSHLFMYASIRIDVSPTSAAPRGSTAQRLTEERGASPGLSIYVSISRSDEDSLTNSPTSK
jgi:hypothetical protein